MVELHHQTGDERILHINQYPLDSEGGRRALVPAHIAPTFHDRIIILGLLRYCQSVPGIPFVDHALEQKPSWRMARSRPLPACDDEPTTSQSAHADGNLRGTRKIDGSERSGVGVTYIVRQFAQ